MDNWLEISAKAIVYAAALVAVGAVAVRVLLLPRVRDQVSPDLLLASRVRGERVTLLAACCLVLAVLIRAWAHTVAAFGMTDASWDNLRLIALESRWGGGWQVQMAAAVLLLTVAASTLLRSSLASAAPRRPAASLPLDLIVVGAVCLALPQTGHAAEHWLRVVLHALHILGGGAWLGALSVTVFAMPKAIRGHLLRAFAPVAASSVALVALSGVAMTLTYIGPLSNLWTSDYGRRLLLKLGVVGTAMAIGGLNWRSLHRSSGAGNTRLPALEAALVVAVVILTAWLTETANP